MLVGCANRTPATPTLHIEIDGDGIGTVSAWDMTRREIGNECSTSCDLSVSSGATINLFVRTADHFGGWGGCSSDGSADLEHCTVSVVDPDSTVTVTVMKDTHEVGAIFPDAPTQVGAFASNGDLVVAGVDSSNQTVLSRITAQGMTLWSTPVMVGMPLAVRAGTDIFVVGATGLAEASSDGAVVWTVGSGGALAIAPSGDAIVAGRTVEVHSRVDGSVLWSRPLPGYGPNRVAADTAGNVDVYTCTSIVRFDSSGNALTSWAVPSPANACASNQYLENAAIALDSQDDLYVYVAGGATGGGAVTRFDSMGNSTSFTAPGVVVTAQTTLDFTAIASVATGHVITAIPNFRNLYYTPQSGAVVASFSPTGTTDWTLMKMAVGEEVPFNTFELFDGVIPTDFSCISTGVCALIGHHQYTIGTDIPYSSNWIELLQP
jgi:hypothetical protein